MYFTRSVVHLQSVVSTFNYMRKGEEFKEAIIQISVYKKKQVFTVHLLNFPDSSV